MFSESKTKKFEAEEKMWEGKGIVENLFHLLWTKDPVFGTSNFFLFKKTI